MVVHCVAPAMVACCEAGIMVVYCVAAVMGICCVASVYGCFTKLGQRFDPADMAYIGLPLTLSMKQRYKH